MLESLKRPPSVQELEEDFEHTPSVANKCRLAQGLYDAGQFARAGGLFKEVLEQRPDDKDGLYGLALCRLALGDSEGAVEPLEKLIEIHKGHREWAAWPALAQALFLSGQTEESLALLEQLVKEAPRMNHQVLRAEYLMRTGDAKQARQQLDLAITENRRSPSHVRRTNRRTAWQARRLMRELS